VVTKEKEPSVLRLPFSSGPVLEMDEVELSFHFYDVIVNIVFAGHRIPSAEGQKQNATRSRTPSVRILVVSVLKRILSD
jgi:hypothetical protein